MLAGAVWFPQFVSPGATLVIVAAIISQPAQCLSGAILRRVSLQCAPGALRCCERSLWSGPPLALAKPENQRLIGQLSTHGSGQHQYDDPGLPLHQCAARPYARSLPSVLRSGCWVGAPRHMGKPVVGRWGVATIPRRSRPMLACYRVFLAQIPADAALTATVAVHPHVSHRRYIYQFPIGGGSVNEAGQAEWALLDVTTNTDMAPGDVKQAVDTLLAGAWGVVDGADGFLPPRRGATAKQLPDAFYDFARGEPNGTAPPPTDTALSFTGAAVESNT